MKNNELLKKYAGISTRIRRIFAYHYDQYYDYSPSQVEAILFGILQLTPEHQDIIVIDLKNT